tara:strand:+ start:518 stop:1333 length:816 start_codon:yes stop_codon:yes gene_type:complete
MFKLKKGSEYSRREVYQTITDSEKSPSYHFLQTGYGRVDEDMFLFINFDFKGEGGHIFPNEFNKEEELLTWYGKKETHSEQPLMRNLINGSYTPYCFGRWDSDSKFTFLGIGKILDYKNNVTIYDDRIEGGETHCIQFKISCKDTSHTSEIYNFDENFEEIKGLNKEGLIRYKRHKTRERNPYVIKKKKNEFIKKHGKLFCEVCDFDFETTYGDRGKGFIECHHNIPLHEQDTERITRTSDLSILCSNCHRMIHRKKKWLTVSELKKILVR